jgi:hypothetical protein
MREEDVVEAKSEDSIRFSVRPRVRGGETANRGV